MVLYIKSKLDIYTCHVLLSPHIENHHSFGAFYLSVSKLPACLRESESLWHANHRRRGVASWFYSPMDARPCLSGSIPPSPNDWRGFLGLSLRHSSAILELRHKNFIIYKSLFMTLYGKQRGECGIFLCFFLYRFSWFFPVNIAGLQIVCGRRL